MEDGRRALGHRSVLARPDRVDLRDRLNLYSSVDGTSLSVPSMLESEASRVLDDWTGGRNRSMTMAHKVAGAYRDRLSGVMSVDGTCRPQIVGDDESGPFADLLRVRVIGTSGPCSTRASISTANLWSARPPKRSMCFFGPAQTIGDPSVPGRAPRMTQTFVSGAWPGRAWIAAGAATLGTIAIPASGCSTPRPATCAKS